MSGRLLLLMALVLVVGFAPAPLPRRRADTEVDDLRRMQGTWVVIQYEHSGFDHLKQYKEEIRFTFQGNRMTCSLNDEVRTRWQVELSPGSPRTVTKTRDDRYVMRGIYRFDGDKLTVCETQGGERPGAFESKGENWLIVMRRR